MANITLSNLDDLIEQKKEAFRQDIDRFAAIGQQFVNGEITSAVFKASSGGMGVYAQKGGKEFMIRLRVLSGVLDYDILKLVNELAQEYQLPFIHLTTRQAIQLHHLPFDRLIEIMEKCQESRLFTKGGGGNYPRNVALSPLSGVAKEEAFDVTGYAILVNKYFLSRMDTYRLPRKFKVAFSNNNEDTANATIADLGFLAERIEDKHYFHVYIGGSLGANGEVAVPYGKLIKPEEVLYHIEACLSLFQSEGDYENKGKARMRYIVKRMGVEAFLACYEEHLSKVKKTGNYDFTIEWEEDPQVDITQNQSSFHWKSQDVIEQKHEGLFTVILHPQGGMLRSEDYQKIVSYLERVPKAGVRLSMEESMYVRNLTEEQAKELLEITKELRRTTRLERSVSCVGVPICQIGIQESQLLLMNIIEYFREKGLTEDILPSLYISGCLNSCGRHQANSIGFQGKKKRVGDATEDVYTLYIGGRISKEDTHLAKEYGDLLTGTIPVFLYELALQLKEKGLDMERFMELYPEKLEQTVQHYLV